MNSRFVEILGSFRRLSTFTQIWLMVFLGPAIFLPLFVLDGPLGVWAAILSVAGFAPAPLMLWRHGGFTKSLAIGHVIFWPILLILFARHFGTAGFDDSFASYAYVFTGIVLLVSLVFDVREVKDWLGGDRGPA